MVGKRRKNRGSCVTGGCLTKPKDEKKVDSVAKVPTGKDVPKKSKASGNPKGKEKFKNNWVF